MKSVWKYLFCFFCGAICYGMLEVYVRGYTHWTMLLTGGAVMCALMFINESECGIVAKSLVGSFVITSFEFMVGSVVNLSLGWNIWNYSGIPFNILGQVCPKYSALWFLLCFPALGICSVIENSVTQS